MYKTAESVSPLHPDKICDRISDAILDECLAQDPDARVAIEAVGGHGQVTITGELTTFGKIDINKIASQYVPDGTRIYIHVASQSHEIAGGVDTGGAGDQGIMVGYATSETPDLIPLETWLARDLNRTLYKKWHYDGKTQITLYKGAVSTVVASFQNTTNKELRAEVQAWLKDKKQSSNVVIHCNPAGEWKVGGFDADAGLTGRKLAIDNYGPHIPIGGGCFSGKDSSKVDRSGAYMARKIAVDLLRKHQADEVFVHLAYAIGVKEPVHAEAKVDGISVPINGYDLSPKGIKKLLNLTKPQFVITAEYGHFGNGFAWDKP